MALVGPTEGPNDRHLAPLWGPYLWHVVVCLLVCVCRYLPACLLVHGSMLLPAARPAATLVAAAAHCQVPAR